MDAVYLFHDLYGYLMQMSPDIAAMIESFEGGVDTEETIGYYRDKLGDADPREFVEILVLHQVLLDPAEDEIEGMWAAVPIKGKWNVWQRRNDRLTIWTAWGDRPVQQVFLDPEETALWDSFEGVKRLIEMRHHVSDNDKLINLVRRLVHSDVQALKLSMMPWSMYAKRPAMAPPYLTSTMPYPSWKPGTPVPATPSLVDYHRHEIPDAEAQFDHLETTLSHLLRVPHPALHGKTYGQALIDALIERKAIPEGRVRVLEIGAGLGYVGRDAIARLQAAGRTVDYTIIELSDVLAVAQKARLGGVTGVSPVWISGDVLAVEPDGTFDLIISNEMAGDLPARQLTRADLGLGPEDGTVDRDKLRAIGGGAALAADLNINLDDAPAEFYLQAGAFELIARIVRWLAPKGTAVVTEFGDVAAWPKLSTHLDHPELSTHFGQLEQLARYSGLDAKTEFVIDLLDFDREQQGLATTRSHFRALRALAADAGIDLPKIGYTPELLAATMRTGTGDGLDLATIGELRWDKIEDRLMGLVPHEFKALIVRKP
ncbi:MAG: SAM-dependent methyltransferase [Deltaproteobacteria bacterium]|nr:SAM-dependent methyltransferase [Deltaproteobacteria bacterium]